MLLFLNFLASILWRRKCDRGSTGNTRCRGVSIWSECVPSAGCASCCSLRATGLRRPIATPPSTSSLGSATPICDCWMHTNSTGKSRLYESVKRWFLFFSVWRLEEWKRVWTVQNDDVMHCIHRWKGNADGDKGKLCVALSRPTRVQMRVQLDRYVWNIQRVDGCNY